MNTEEPSSGAGDLGSQVRDIWNENAEWWDERTGPEGPITQRELVGPATERLLALKPGERVLDVACGNGNFARRMVALGASVVAFDFSEKFIERAKARTTENADRIEYRTMDATNEGQLLSLGEGSFDAAVVTMALMDMAEIAPLFRSVRRLLKPEGRFVFSVPHPCFNTTDTTKAIEEEDRGGELVDTYSVKLVRYLTPMTARGLGIVGQPSPHYYFDRPLHLLLGEAFAAGLVVDGLDEPRWPATTVGNQPLSWVNFKEIPQVMIVRLRPGR